MVASLGTESHGARPLPAWDKPEDMSAMLGGGCCPAKYRDMHRRIYMHREKVKTCKGTMDAKQFEREVADLQERAVGMQRCRERHKYLAARELKVENARLVERLCSVVRESESRQKQLLSATKGAAGMLNAAFRRKAASQVDKDNKVMLDRLKHAGPGMKTLRELNEDYKAHQERVSRRSRFQQHRRVDVDFSKPPKSPMRPRGTPTRPEPYWRRALNNATVTPEQMPTTPATPASSSTAPAPPSKPRRPPGTAPAGYPSARARQNNASNSESSSPFPAPPTDRCHSAEGIYTPSPVMPTSESPTYEAAVASTVPNGERIDNKVSAGDASPLMHGSEAQPALPEERRASPEPIVQEVRPHSASSVDAARAAESTRAAELPDVSSLAVPESSAESVHEDNESSGLNVIEPSSPAAIGEVSAAVRKLPPEQSLSDTAAEQPVEIQAQDVDEAVSVNGHEPDVDEAVSVNGHEAMEDRCDALPPADVHQPEVAGTAGDDLGHTEHHHAEIRAAGLLTAGCDGEAREAMPESHISSSAFASPQEVEGAPESMVGVARISSEAPGKLSSCASADDAAISAGNLPNVEAQDLAHGQAEPAYVDAAQVFEAELTERIVDEDNTDQGVAVEADEGSPEATNGAAYDDALMETEASAAHNDAERTKEQILTAEASDVEQASLLDPLDAGEADTLALDAGECIDAGMDDPDADLADADPLDGGKSAVFENDWEAEEPLEVASAKLTAAADAEEQNEERHDGEQDEQQLVAGAFFSMVSGAAGTASYSTLRSAIAESQEQAESEPAEADGAPIEGGPSYSSADEDENAGVGLARGAEAAASSSTFQRSEGDEEQSLHTVPDKEEPAAQAAAGESADLPDEDAEEDSYSQGYEEDEAGQSQAEHAGEDDYSQGFEATLSGPLEEAVRLDDEESIDVPTGKLKVSNAIDLDDGDDDYDDKYDFDEYAGSDFEDDDADEDKYDEEYAMDSDDDLPPPPAAPAPKTQPKATAPVKVLSDSEGSEYEEDNTFEDDSEDD